jgi:WD40 repeat protein
VRFCSYFLDFRVCLLTKSLSRRIYAFTPLNLTLPSPVQTFTSPLARYSSFYVRCAVSPDSRYLAAGSSDGGVLLWDTEGNGKDAVRVKGHEREVSGLDWSSEGVRFFHFLRHLEA